MKTNAQSALEFMIFAALMFFFFTIFLFAVNGNISGRIIEEKNYQIKDIAFTLHDEINLAIESSEGYYREFNLPLKIHSQTYTISILEGETIYAISEDAKNTISLHVSFVNGQPQPGKNNIRKIQGEIFLNAE